MLNRSWIGAVAVAIIVGAALASGLAEGVEIASESFDYEANGSVRGLAGGAGWNGPWFGAETAEGVTTSETGLTFAGLEAQGRSCRQDGRDTRLFRRIDVTRPEVERFTEESGGGRRFGKDGTTVWVAFLIANRSFPLQAHGGLHLMDGVQLGPLYKRTQRVQLGRQNMGEHWLLVRTDQGGPAAGRWDGTVVSDGTVRLLVYRFDFRAGAEEAWMWVDPKPGREPDVQSADLHAPAVADFRFDALNIGSGGGVLFDFDELRIGTTFADVAPAAAK